MRLRFGAGRRVLVTLAAVLAVAGPVLVASAPAAASDKYCGGSASHRIGHSTGIWTAYGQYGWAEWRQGSAGSCYNWQWVSVHMTKKVYTWYVDGWADGCDFGVNMTQYTTGRRYWTWRQRPRIDPGTWNTFAFYSPTHKVKAEMCGGTSKGNGFYFGTYPWAA